MKFEGVFTALVTPFISGEIDYTSLKKLIGWQLDQGVKGFVVNGTTAESPTLTREEVHQLFDFVKSEVSGQVPLILGTGSNSTRVTVDNTKAAKELGADAALVVVPYYNKPTQKGLFEHFRTISEFTDLPIILYNVPGRTIVALELETIKKLSSKPTIMGIKDATADIELAKQTVDNCGPGFLVTSGDDGTCVEFAAVGGHGVISVGSHVIPKAFIDSIGLARDGKKSEAADLFGKYTGLLNQLYVESNPIPVKAALKMMGLIRSDELRLPLTALSDEYRPGLEKALKDAGVLS